MRFPSRVPGSALLVAAVVGLLSLTIVGTWYLRVYFGQVSLDQLLFHLGQGGLSWADSKALWRALRSLLLWLLLCALLLWLQRSLQGRLRPLFWGALLTAAGASVASSLRAPCLSGPQADLLASWYADPRQQQVLRSEPAPDLLLVWVESLDSAYAGKRVFGQPLVPGLARWRDEQRRFGRLHMLDGASWTMAGLFSSLCGLPLQSVGLLTAKSTDRAERFFAKGQCLSDWMAAQGWELSFYGGASLDFAGKGRFFAEHGVSRRFGREEWQALGVPVPSEGWGLADTALVEQVMRQWERPRDAQTPRASLVLTVDTHDPHGNPDPDCGIRRPADSEGQLRTALACTDAAVMRLVEAFVARRDGRPKLVWVMGDHLSKAHPLMQGLEAAALIRPRGIFHAVGRWDAEGRPVPVPPPALDRQFTHLDVAPTLAQLLGLRWGPDADRLGLGVSLVAPQPRTTLMEEHGLERLNARFACPSPLFARLWS